MRFPCLLGLLCGLALGACFTDEGGFVCNPGEGGCACNQGVCLEGLECTSGYCTRKGCEPGTEFCVCDDAGECESSDLECFEGIVCRPKKGKGDPTGGTDTDGSESGSSTTFDSTTADETDTSDTEGGCEPACGECRACNAKDECVPDPGMPCDGPALQCSDYLFGLVGGATCHALAPGEVPPVCNSQGQCVSATAQDCALEAGEVIADCEASCVKAPGLCAPFTPADGLVLDAFCEQDGTTPECGTSCFNGSYAQVDVNVCDQGICVEMDEIPCDAYACVNGACNQSCDAHIDCSMFHKCDFDTGMCVDQ